MQSASSFGGDKQYLAVQLIRLVEQFLASDKLDIPSLWHQDEKRRRLLFALNMDTVVAHVHRFVTEQNVERLAAVFDESRPIGSTAQMRPWLTTKPCQPTRHSQISHAVHDSVWEKAVVDICEKRSSLRRGRRTTTWISLCATCGRARHVTSCPTTHSLHQR